MTKMRYIKVNINNLRSIFISFLILILGTFCTPQVSTPNPGTTETKKLKVVATTTIIGDVVRHVGGDLIDLEIFLPVGTDPHSFEPTPQDISKLTEADVLFINGAGLEVFLEPLIEGSGINCPIVDLSQGIPLIDLNTYQKTSDQQDNMSYDPHVWMDPKNVVLWVEKVADVLSELDRESANRYESNSLLYIQELENLDDWIKNEVEEIPPENRMLLTDHLDLGYFAESYGFEQIGATIPSFSSQSQATAQELAALEDIIHEKHVKAIFVNEYLNPDLARRVAEDTGIQIVPIYIGSLSGENEPAGNYIDLIRYDVQAIVNVLR